jgi:16S rRNA (adenine1518-N6/adenine1519-N6)-dimethyltransferase
MSARPGTREYGVLSVLMQACAKIELLRHLPPHVFWPPPKVSSMLVRARMQEPLHVDPAALFRVAGEMLGHRRKRADKAMQMAGLVSCKEAGGDLLADCGVEPAARSDHITVDQFVSLTSRIARNPCET